MFQSHFDEILYSQIDFFLVGRTHYGLEGERRRSSFSVRGAIGFNGTKADPGAAFGSAIRLVATDDAHVENARAKCDGSKNDRIRRAFGANRLHFLSISCFRCVWRSVCTTRERQGLSHEVQPTP